ncbi:putative serine/threonine-protein kinase YPL150W [Actinidia eriantha]|uniref:putative serine/threonine-protein kinase YPL150W n=1 Tax=Actinidia eriantha TaxID=165200 RepID=UPI00258C0967|nr:putative serine/threonine-protein kinase YPL150W [Actinidia eriantha]
MLNLGNAINSGVIQFEESCRRFSLDKILRATNNFDDELAIGTGGFGKVYKGFINNGTTTVAIKRLKAESKQGEKEFWTEVKILSKLRHAHLVALIGYCNDSQEMILVYEYIARGNLADHLYKSRAESSTNISPLLWEQRIKICIGAALGLNYLHTGTHDSYIHRDVKTTNILLNENWAAKVSDFGLSKGTMSHLTSHVSTDVKGTWGYLDPDYFFTHRLTQKSDVYAFGVVLLEVLCGRPPVDTNLKEEQISLIRWAQQCIKKGKLHKIIDPSLSTQITPRSLKYFVELAHSCLHQNPKARPSMARVIGSLQLVLASQQKGRTEGILTKVFQGIGFVAKGTSKDTSQVPKGILREPKSSPKAINSVSLSSTMKDLSQESCLEMSENISQVSQGIIFVAEGEPKAISVVSHSSTMKNLSQESCLGTSKDTSQVPKGILREPKSGSKAINSILLSSTMKDLSQESCSEMSEDISQVSQGIIFMAEGEPKAVSVVSHSSTMKDLSQESCSRMSEDKSQVSQGILLVVEGAPKAISVVSHSSPTKDLSQVSCLGTSKDLRQVLNSGSNNRLHDLSLVEIRKAINDFDDDCLIPGSRNMYIGSVNMDERSLVVAIKRFKEVTLQEWNELQPEIMVQRLCRHPNLVSLLGFFYEEHELILVYEYMARGSLRDLLKTKILLMWEKRLEICISAAEGLQYLHMVKVYPNIKLSNIFLNEKLVAKVRDVKFPKMIPTSSSSTCTDVSSVPSYCNKWGDLDPKDHLVCGQNTLKNDIYSFGVVLLQVLISKVSLNRFLKVIPGYHGLPLCDLLKNILQLEAIDYVIEPYLIGKIAPESLKEYVKIALSCLSEQEVQPHSMDYVVESLRSSLQLQKMWQTHNQISASYVPYSSLEKYFEDVGQLVRTHAPKYVESEGRWGFYFF